MSKGQRTKLMKELVAALKEESLTKEDVRELFKEHTFVRTEDAVRKRVERYLADLCNWGLANEHDGRFWWYIYLSEFKDQEDYAAKTQHAKQLIPALKAIVGLPFDQQVDPYTFEVMKQSAKQHLGYYEDLDECQSDQLSGEDELQLAERDLRHRLETHLSRAFGGTALSEMELTENSIYAHLPDLIAARLVYNQRTPKLEPSKFAIDKLNEGEGILLLDGMQVARGDESVLKKAERFIMGELNNLQNGSLSEKILGAERRTRGASTKLRAGVLELTLRIESGEPLRGKCNTCPRTLRSSQIDTSLEAARAADRPSPSR